LWDLDNITSKQHIKIYAQTVQGLCVMQAWQHPTIAAPIEYINLVLQNKAGP